MNAFRKPSLKRRSLIAATTAFFLSPGRMAWAAERSSMVSAHKQLEAIEKDLDGRLGVFALDTASGAQLAYRADERFPFCSTFKVIAASAILAKSVQVPGLLQQRIAYAKKELVTYSPITEKHVDTGMTIAELCAAAIRYSDNTAANLMIANLGGTQAVTAFARSIGDDVFRLDRWETELNSAVPGDLRDTTTPQAMGNSLNRLALGDALPPEQRAQLCDWLLGNTTGATRIKAGIPSDWKIGDKTGTGDYGTANDVGVVWPVGRAPIIVAIYTTRNAKNAEPRADTIAAASRVIVDWLAKK